MCFYRGGGDYLQGTIAGGGAGGGGVVNMIRLIFFQNVLHFWNQK